MEQEDRGWDGMTDAHAILKWEESYHPKRVPASE